MKAFRVYLMVILMAVSVYTGLVVAKHGANLFPVFFTDIAAMGWPGQFNLDFMFMLAFSAIWVAWRHRFTAAGLVLGVMAFLGGAPFLCVYLLVQSRKSADDPRKLLLGDREAS